MKKLHFPSLGLRRFNRSRPGVHGLSAATLTFLALVSYRATITPANAEDFAQGANSFSPFRAQTATHVSRNSDQSSIAERTPAAAQRADAMTGSPIIAPTRSSFLASWETSAGSKGYRLDVSTDSSFTEYVSGYRDLDVGDTNSRIVFGLKPGTTYYYRVRAYDSNSASANSPVTSATTAISSGLVINPTFDASITGDPNSAAIQAAINIAIANYQSLFSDPMTVSILFRYANTAPDGTVFDAGVLAESAFTLYAVPWATFITALRADSKTANDSSAIASLPVNALSTLLLPSSANGRAVGLSTPGGMAANGTVNSGGTFDGIVTLNSAQLFQFTRPPSSGTYDARTAIQHEMDEVLGLGSFLNFGGSNLRPEDLFSWSALSTRSIKTTGPRYFSIDSGRTDIVGLSQDLSGDLGDWLSQSCPQANPYVQNAFSCPGQFDDVLRCSPEGIALDVIGYDLVGSSGPYDPRTDCTIVEWLKADDLALADGSEISLWPAAAGSDLFQIFLGEFPIFESNVLNGLPVVRTDGLQQWMYSETFSTPVPQPNQIFMVFRTQTTKDGYFFSGDSLVSTLQVISVASGHWDFLSHTVDQNLGPVNTNWNILFVEANGATSRYRFNNGSIVNMSSSPGTDGFSNLEIGAGINANGNPQGFTNTDYAEIIVRSGASDPSAVMTYLNTKWNVYSTASPTPTPTPGPTPQVTISASPTSVAHRGSSTITVKRSNVSSQAITVSYITGGTAILGSSYTLSGSAGNVVIPASQTSATITLQSVNTAPHAHNQNANIRLNAGPGYKLGSPSNVTVTLLAY